MRQYESEMGRDIDLIHTLVWPIAMGTVSRPKSVYMLKCC